MLTYLLHGAGHYLKDDSHSACQKKYPAFFMEP